MDEIPPSPVHSPSETIQPTLSPPRSPVFHGFGPETTFPERIVLDTDGEGDEEHLVRVYRVKKMGRPSIGWEKDKTIIITTIDLNQLLESILGKLNNWQRLF